MIKTNQGYSVVVAESVITAVVDFVSENFPNSKLFFLVDENTEEHCFDPFNWVGQKQFEEAEVLSIDSGEASKSLALVEQLAATMLELGANRNSLLINLGGGVISDLGGFLASVFKRGIPFINIPTSLLAMVDASVGGKTGVNVFGSKNQVGTFSFPKAVFCGTEFLQTLPQRELISGYAELIKHALIANKSLWQSCNELDLNTIPTVELLKQSIAIKNEIVSADPFENGVRKKLNFGHTVGHAVESLSLIKQQPLLHGEAIAIGMCAEAYLSHQYAELPLEEYNEIVELLASNFELGRIKLEDVTGLLEFVLQDKKNPNHAINFSLLKSIGNCEIDFNLSPESIQEKLQEFIAKL